MYQVADGAFHFIRVNSPVTLPDLARTLLVLTPMHIDQSMLCLFINQFMLLCISSVVICNNVEIKSKSSMFFSYLSSLIYSNQILKMFIGVFKVTPFPSGWYLFSNSLGNVEICALYMILHGILVCDCPTFLSNVEGT